MSKNLRVQITQTAPEIEITPRAIEMGKRQLQEFADENENPTLGLRVGGQGWWMLRLLLRVRARTEDSHER